MIGLYVQQMPAHAKASVRHTEYDIPGRNGSVTTVEGYEPFDMPCTLICLDKTADIRQIINAWADGTGRLITSDQPGMYWDAAVLQQITYQRREYGDKFFDSAQVIFRCQPIMHATSDSAMTFTADGSITNVGNVTAYPLIVVTGIHDVTFSIAGQEITLRGMASPVTIDCETGYVYTSTVAAEMVGEIPALPIGTSQITIGNAQKIEITPRWGWV